MEAIRNYLNQMFASLPDTPQVQSMKEDLLVNMEDKYHQLINEGKNDHEAIGIVISEFGNLDELIREFNIDVKINEAGDHRDKKLSLPAISQDVVNRFMSDYRKIATITALATAICMLGVVTILIWSEGYIVLFENAKIRIGLIPLFACITIGAGMFVYTGMVMNKYTYLTGSVSMPTHIKANLEAKYKIFYKTYMKSVIIGVVIAVASPIVLLGEVREFFEYSKSNSAGILILILTVAVYIFVYYGTIYSSYIKILGIEEHSKAFIKEQDDYFGK